MNHIKVVRIYVSEAAFEVKAGKEEQLDRPAAVLDCGSGEE